jgi:hypothetical protein
MMRYRLPRSLVLVSGLLFALPEGWCCLLAAELNRRADEATPAKRPECCTCPGSCEESQPAPARRPVIPPTCPCSQRQTILPVVASAKHMNAAAVFVAVPSPVIGAPDGVRNLEQAVCVVHPPTCALHIFECIWRC